MRRLFNTAARQISSSRLFSAAIDGLEAIGDRKPDLLRVLTYHRVAEPNQRRDLDPTIVSATPSQFTRQIDWLCAKFNPVSLDSLRAAIDGKCSLPPRSVLLTFDDAYADFAEHAWPILRSRGVPVVLFVPTAYPDGTERSFWWDRLHCAIQASGDYLETPIGRFDTSTHDSRQSAARRLKGLLKSLPHESILKVVDHICHHTDAPQPDRAVLDWDQLRQLAHDGVTLGAHTHSHPLLNRISTGAVTEEIVRSRDLLTEQIGSAPAAFAFPSGHYDEHSVAQVREAGFEFAFTTVGGINTLDRCDPHRLRRTNVRYQKPEALMRAQLHAMARHLNHALPRSYQTENQPTQIDPQVNGFAENGRMRIDSHETLDSNRHRPAHAEPAQPSVDSNSANRSHVRGSVLLVCGRVIAIATNFVVQILTVRYLGKANYGMLAFALSVASVASMTAAFGMNKAMTRFLPVYLQKRQYDRFWGALSIAVATIGIMATLVVCLLVALWWSGASWLTDSSETSLVLAIVAGIAFCDAFDSLFMALFAVLAKPSAIFWRRHLLGPMLRLIAAVVVAIVGGNIFQFAAYQVIASAIGLSISVGLLVSLVRANARLQVALSRQAFTYPLAEIYRFSATLLSNDLSFLLRTSLVPIVLGVMYVSTEVAEYQAVFPLARLNEFVLISFSILFLPTAARMAVAKQHAELQTLYDDTTTWITLLSLPMFAIMFMGAEFLPVLLFGDQYQSSAAILSWLALGYFTNASLGTAQRVLHATGKLRTLLVIDVAMIVIAIVLVGALVTAVGAVGGAIAVFFMYVIQAGFYQLAAWKQTVVNPFNWRATTPLLIGVGLCMLGAVVRHWFELPPVVGAVGGAVIAFGVLAAFRHRLELAGTFPELGRVPFVGRWLTPATAGGN